MKRRFLAALLTLAMLCSMLPVPALAVDSDFTIDADGVLTTYTGPGGDVVIPDGVTSIGVFAFSNCSALTSVVISEGVTSIGGNAFQNCTNLAKITIPKSVTSLGSMGDVIGAYTSVFGQCQKLKSAGPIGSGCDIEFGWDQAIPNHAFKQCGNLTDITIPSGVTSIGQGAFEGCRSLVNITIPDGVTSIGLSTFAHCSFLPNISIPDSVTSIGASAFDACTSLTSITIPSSVTSIGASAFNGCKKLDKVTIPNSVTSLNSGIFRGCSNLKTAGPIGSGCNIEFGWTDTIPAHAFNNCASLTNITIPGNVTSIGDSAFSGCKGLTSFIIPNGVTDIGDFAFSGCTGLTSVVIPEGAVNIGEQTFSFCTALVDITIPNSVASIGNSAFSSCVSLRSAKVLSSTTVLGEDAFYRSSSPLLTVYGHIGSPAHTFCTENNISFTTLEEEPTQHVQLTSAMFTVSTDREAYTGFPITKTIVGKHDGALLVEGADYIVEYTRNTNVGTATITVIGKRGYVGTVIFTFDIYEDISPVPVAATGVSLQKTGSVLRGHTSVLHPIVSPGNATNKSVYWTSDDTSVVTVSTTGVLTGLRVGTANITATTVDGGFKATCLVTVTSSGGIDGSPGGGTTGSVIGKRVPVTGVSVADARVRVGQNLTLSATLKPSNATNKRVYWTSNDTDVVTVNDNGTLTGVKTGTAKVTVTTQDGNFTDTCTVTVYAASTISGGGGGGGGAAGGGGGGGGAAQPSATPSAQPSQKPIDTSKPASENFADVVKGSWYEDGVTYVVQKGLFQGVADRTFAPQQNMTRAMLVTVLARLDGHDTTGGATWYAKATDWAKAQGISDGTMLESSVTREQMVTMLYRYTKATAGTAELSAFADGATVSDWAKDAMAWAVSKGIITGKDGALLDPQGTATRAEVATILQRFVEKK